MKNSIALSRRSFVAGTAGALTAAFGARASAAPLAPRDLGVELYTVRNIIKGHEDEVLRNIAQIGYREVEGGYPDVLHLASAATAAGVKITSCHVPADIILGGEHASAPFDKALDELKAIGVEYAVVPYIAPSQRTTAYFDDFGARMNRAGKMAKDRGMTLAYHNHAFEWGQLEGKRTFDRMFANTDPDLVKFEVDVFWLAVGGVDPVEFLNSHANRIPLLHLKDKNAALSQAQYNENVPKDTFKEIGHGSLNFPAILRTASRIGVKHYFVEQDWTPGDPVASLRQSFEYLTSLRA